MRRVISTILFLSIVFVENVHSEINIPYGNWNYIEGKSFKNIHTKNSQGLDFGYSCNSECIFYISPAMVCQMGRVTNGWMIQESGVSKRINTLCIEHEGGQLLKVMGDSQIINLLKSNKNIHFLVNWDVSTNSLMSFNLLGFSDSLKRLNQ